jgi:TonB family protein
MMRLAWSLMAASALHVAVLAGPGLRHAGGSESATRMAAYPATNPLTNKSISGPAWQWRLVSATSSPSPDAANGNNAPDPSGGAQLATDSTVQAATETAASAESADSQANARHDAYLPRGLLTRPPRALAMIDIPFPPGVPTPGRYRAVLALYIDETGTVRRVKVADAQLPAAYEEAARNAFQAASFTPGELKGLAVKSLIHIEVVFDETPAGKSMGATSLAQAHP